MRIDLAVVCDHAALTLESKPVIVGIFDRLTVSSLPWAHPHMVLVFRAKSEPGDDAQHNLEIHLIDPDGADVIPVATGEFTAADPSMSGSAWTLFELNGVPFAKAGEYRFDLLVDGKHQRSAELSIEYAPSA
jgi:hypothetical protein